MSVATAVRESVAPVPASSAPDPRRLTESDPDFVRLHARTQRKLMGSIRQAVRDVRASQNAPVTQRSGLLNVAIDNFQKRHLRIMQQAYEDAHVEGQVDYWHSVSNQPGKQRVIPADTKRLQKTIAHYTPSVAKMASELSRVATASRSAVRRATEASITAILLDDPPETLNAWQDSVVPRVALQAQVTWPAMNDGYIGAGAADPANPFAEIWWNLEPFAQHCEDCPQFAAGSPYTAPGSGGNELTNTPGDGTMECGAACKCDLEYDAPAAGPVLDALNQAKADQWSRFLAGDPTSPLAPITVGGIQPKGTVLTPLKRGYIDEMRQASADWEEARGALPSAPDWFRPQDWANAPVTPWGPLTPYQREILERMSQINMDWLHEVGQLNWPTPPFRPDVATEMRQWLEAASRGDFTPWWKDYQEPMLPHEALQQWFEWMAKANLWPDPPPIDEKQSMEAWLEEVGKSVNWPPDFGRNEDSGNAGENTTQAREIDLPTIKLVNNYPRQSGGRFGFGPGTAAAAGGAKGTKGTKGTAAKGGTAKTTKAAKASKAAATPSASAAGSGSVGHRAPTIEEQKAAAEKRLKDAKAKSNKADRDFAKAEKDAAAKQAANKDEIARAQEERSKAYLNEFHSYSDARDAIAEERANAKGTAGKTKTAVTNYEKMQAAKQPYEDAKAEYASAEAKAAASKAIANDLNRRYYDYNKYGYDLAKMGKDHPDWKAADKQSWADERARIKAQTALFRAQGKYETPRNVLAGKISDADIEARPERIAAKAALKEADAKLGELNGQPALRAAWEARSSAHNDLKDAQTAMEHPTWKYELRSAPTTHAAYTSLNQWPTGELGGARSNDNGNRDVHVGDLALSELEHAQGFDGKPDIVTEDELENFAKNGEVELWRGDTKLSHTDEMMTGDYHAGLGIRGNGTYAQETSAGGHQVAQSYAGQRGQTSSGKIMRMTVKSDARVIDYSDLQRESTNAWQRAKSDQQNALNRGDRGAARRAGLLAWVSGSDTSRYAVALGYDAIRIDSGSGKGQWIILNRTAVRISHQIRGA